MSAIGLRVVFRKDETEIKGNIECEGADYFVVRSICAKPIFIMFESWRNKIAWLKDNTITYNHGTTETATVEIHS